MSTSDVTMVEAPFYGTGKDQIMNDLDKMFWPRGAVYWQRCIEEKHSFVHKIKLQIMLVPFVMVKDPFFHQKKMMGSIVDLTTARKGLSVVLEEEHEEAPPTLKRRQKPLS